MSAPAGAAQRATSPPRGGSTERPKPRGPIAAVVAVGLGFLASMFTSLFLGTAFEIFGLYALWPAEGVGHARSHVTDDLDYLKQFPRSVFVPDTVAFAREMADWARWPFDRMGVPQLIEKAAHADSTPAKNAMARGLRQGYLEIVRWIEVFYHVAQDLAVRLSVALFASPAFFLAIMVGLVDGLVKRDLRKWCGGRESSFVYHHSKHYTGWFLTGGFALYLAWPFRGFNPADMVLVFTVLVAASLSLTVASFKKYL
jgi:integrating conjugative element membrane protein (TIGR03747 family)